MGLVTHMFYFFFHNILCVNRDVVKNGYLKVRLIVRVEPPPLFVDLFVCPKNRCFFGPNVARVANAVQVNL